jgi:phosphate ABC transporter phosphate-binding protein
MQRSVGRSAAVLLVQIAALGVISVTLGCKREAKTPDGLVGDGSTFVYPLMVQWASEYEKKEGGCKIAYRSLGSGIGISDMTEKKTDFGCSDAPMTDTELAKARPIGREVLHIPLVLGAVVPAYNLPGVQEPLRFSGTVLADIFLGTIKRWNDERLQKLNPGVLLPDREIVVVHRRDDSGTTYIWSDYLAKVSPQWKQQVGTGHDIRWPTGKAEVGNEGVSEYVKNNADTLGYIELAYAHRKELTFGLVQNREHEFVKPGLQSTITAAQNALDTIPEDLRYSITDAPGKGSYPICGTTWALVYVNQPAGKGKDLKGFLQWVLEEGQDRCEPYFYARLPGALVTRAKERIERIQLAR